MKKSDRLTAFVEQLDTDPSLALDPCYQGYFTCFNAAQYYEAHDVLEHLWLQCRDENYSFYKGLIQIAGAFVHLKLQSLYPAHPKHGRRLQPAARLFLRGIEHIAPYGPRHLRLDVAALCKLSASLASDLAESNFSHNPWNADHPPQLELGDPSNLSGFRAPEAVPATRTKKRVSTDPNPQSAIRNPQSPWDVIVIGGGAAGLMCALQAGRRGRRVMLLEHNDRVGKKIAISGGGRCNFTNLEAGPDNYLSGQPDFCKSALARFTPWDFVAFVEKHGIAYHEKKLGQQFCDGSARQIIEMLLEECRAANVKVTISCRVSAVRRTDRFHLETSVGAFDCASLVVATGGLSFPKLGATDFGYRIAKQFGLRLTEIRPGLVPVTFTGADTALGDLSGLSIPVIARNGGQEFRENLLFTHRGLSGPAVLQISSYWRESETLHFNLLPDADPAQWLAAARAENIDLPTLLSRSWPRRFAEAWIARHTPAKPLAHFKARELSDLAELLGAWPFTPSGTEGYAKAEVTLGGVDTSELSSKTMESRGAPGLFFIGEVVDVTGWLGGYNFQWAWASGHAAGLAA